MRGCSRPIAQVPLPIWCAKRREANALSLRMSTSVVAHVRGGSRPFACGYNLPCVPMFLSDLAHVPQSVKVV